MLIGEYSQAVGDKNRIAIPKKLRIQLEGEIILTRGYDFSLIMIDQRRWKLFIEEINTKPLLTLTNREIKRYLLGGSFNIEPDNQGRFVLPEQLKQFSGIIENVIFLGVGEWIEIWDKDKWEGKLKLLSNNIRNLSENLYKESNNHE